MISKEDAYALAKGYFRNNLGKDSISKAAMSEEAWFFISGESNRDAIGNVVISISRQAGEIALIDLLSDEGFGLIKATTPVDLPY